MTIEVRPLGVKCNIQCLYCYQHPQRDAGNVLHRYDMEKMKASLEAMGGQFSIFGGEALLMPEEDLEELWAWGFEKFGANGIQTNGALINDNHIRMFKAYKVHVGISIDGPGELNDARWAGSLERTRATTAKSLAAIERLLGEGVSTSLIVTLHRGNATADKLPHLIDWLKHLENRGLSSARLHMLEVDNEAVRQKFALSHKENLAALLAFLKLEPELRGLKLDVFTDMRHMLQGQDKTTTCIWNGCDSYNTRAVQGVEGNGQRSNCGRTNKDGIDFAKADREGFERYIALYFTPQEYGGCQGCRFFLMCKGNCPGTAIDGDWRNRTEHCETWFGLYAHLESELLAQDIQPLSLNPIREQVEQRLVNIWAAGQTARIEDILTQLQPEQATTSCAQPNGRN